MQTVYATHLPLPTVEKGKGLDAALGSIRRWTTRRFGVTIQNLFAGTGSGRGASLRWELLLGDGDQGLFSLRIDQADEYTEGLRWRTHVDVGIDNGNLWLRVRVALSSTKEGVVVPPEVKVGRPGIVKDLIEELDVEVDGRTLGTFIQADSEEVDDYLSLITDPTRRLPVVAVSANLDGSDFISPAYLNDRLLGMAHVAALSTEAAWAVTNAISRELSCYGGALRIYWPQFDLSDDRYRHRLYVGGVLEALGPDGIVDEIFGIIGRTAGLSIDESDLYRQLARQRRESELEHRVEERALALSRLEEAKSQGKGVTEEEFAAFSREFAEMEERVGHLELETLEAAEEVEALRAERDAAARQVVEISRTFSNATIGDTKEVETTLAPPGTILDAVKRARANASHTIYLEESLSSAAESQYPDPTRVLEYLDLIEEVATQWREGSLQQGPAEEFLRRTAAYRRGVSDTALNAYEEDYARNYLDQKIFLGPHFRRGTGAVTSILRIYFYIDTVNKTIVVGHVGKKLRDKSNNN